jgi:hypothetical protein
MNGQAQVGPLQPILVVLVWRGGARFVRALDSIRDAEKYFKRVVLSITALPDSEDIRIAERYIRECAQSGSPSKAEIICTQTELPTMHHQEFWIHHLLTTGAHDEDWIFWLAYDDQLRLRGLQEVVPNELQWPLAENFAYFGPWGMRHESPDQLWELTPGERLETWTGFEKGGPKVLNPTEWTLDQLIQPTYIQMSGSVASLKSHANLINGFPRKSGPMRIELATALESRTKWVTEFSSALTYIYGRSNSDRSNYAKAAAREDRDLALRLLKRCALNPSSIPLLFGRKFRKLLSQLIRKETKVEDWRVSGIDDN